MYNYEYSVKEDVKNYIIENGYVNKYSDKEELEQLLNEELWTEDSVTGNASGSYTFDRVQASLYVLDNMDLLDEAVEEFQIESGTIGDRFLSEDWEWMDVIIRLYCLPQAIAEAIEEI